MEDTAFRIGEERERPKKRRNSVWQYPVYACAYALLSFGQSGMINCFSESFFLASVLCASGVALFPLYAVTTLLYLNDLPRLITSLIVSLCASVAAETSKKTKLKHTLPVVFAVATLVRVGCAFVVTPVTLAFLINCIFLPLVAYPLYIALWGVYDKPKGYRGSTLELGCSAVSVALFSCAVASAGVLYPVYGLGAFLLCLVTALYGKGEGVICAVSVGVGIALYSYDTQAVAFFAFVSIIYALFSSAPRALGVVALSLAAVIFRLLFPMALTDMLIPLVSLIVGGALYCVLPRSLIERAKSVLCSPFDKSGMRYLVASGRAQSAGKIERISKVFGEMSKTLATERRGSVNRNAVAATLNERVCAKCGRCKESERITALCSLLDLSEKRGRATVSELAYFLEVNCNHIAHLISLGAEYADELKKAKLRQSEEDKLRAEMAQSFDCVRAILEKTAKGLLEEGVGGDGRAEELIVEELRAEGVVVLDALVISSVHGKISLVVACESDADDIAALVGRITKSAYAVEKIERSGNIRVITLRERTPYDALFAVSSLSKSAQATGDTHSFIRISDSKFMMALCDGMGSGVGAGEVSESAIALVENFYKAGFSSQFVIETVNRFLSYRLGESFAAFDILVCDLFSLERTVIKLGSPVSFIKSGEGVVKMEGNALPLGALGEITPCVFTDKADEGQTVVFLSDGVSDRLSVSALASLIASVPDYSVQKLTDTILERAVSAKGGAISDDMTVIAVKVSRRI